MSVQAGWNWCSLCQGLFFSGGASKGVCPVHGNEGHDSNNGEFSFAVVTGNVTAGAQPGWRFCWKCAGMFFSGNPGSVCPAGQAHDASKSGHYSIQFGDNVPGTQGLWRWCRKCQGMFFSGDGSMGACPVGTTATSVSPHDPTGSGAYGVPWPNPTTSWDTGTGKHSIAIGGNPADANIAASSSHVCVTARAAFACYTKMGTLVSPGPGFAAAPITAKKFFEESGISTITSFTNDSNFTKDGRVVFEPFLKRFFLVVQSRESPARLLIACSKTEDPSDGWHTYADVVGNAAALVQDYQFLGINGKYLLVTNGMGGKWRHFMYSTAEMAEGKPYTRGEWADTAAERACPCVHNSFTTDAYWVHRDDDTTGSVWGVRDGNVTTVQFSVQSSSGPIKAPEPGGLQVDFQNIGRAMQNAQYRDGKIVCVSNDGASWDGVSGTSNAVRLLKLDVSKFYDASPSVTVEIDRIFGKASADDPAGQVFDYGWPAVAANANGDIVVGSVRCNPTTFPELRASVWYHGKPDIESSVLLAAGTGPLTEYHMAGACTDPSSNGIYLAQQWNGSNPTKQVWRIRVVKMLDYPL